MEPDRPPKAALLQSGLTADQIKLKLKSKYNANQHRTDASARCLKVLPLVTGQFHSIYQSDIVCLKYLNRLRRLLDFYHYNGSVILRSDSRIDVVYTDIIIGPGR